MVRLTLQPVFTHLYDVSFTSPSEDLRCMWTVITKAKSSICQGDRLENLSWRLWYASTKGFSRLIDADGNLLPNNELPSHRADNERPGKNSSPTAPHTTSHLTCAQTVTQASLASATASSSRPPSPKAATVENNVRILHSLSNVLEEIRDSIPTSSSHGHHRKGRNGSHNGNNNSNNGGGGGSNAHRTGSSKGHSFSHTHGLYAHFGTKSSTATKSHSSVSPPRSNLFMPSAPSPSSATAHKKYAAATNQAQHTGSLVSQNLGPLNSNNAHGNGSATTPASTNTTAGTGTLTHGVSSQLSSSQKSNSRSAKPVANRPALHHRYSGHYSQNIAGLDSDSFYQIDPNDPEHALPATTFPYDEAQFELASRALGLAPVATEPEPEYKTGAGVLPKKSPHLSAVAPPNLTSQNLTASHMSTQPQSHLSYELGEPVPLETAPKTSLLSILLGGANSNSVSSHGQALSPPSEIPGSTTSLPMTPNARPQTSPEFSTVGKTSVTSQTDSTASPCHKPLTSVAQAPSPTRTLSHHSSNSSEISTEAKVYHHLSDVDSSNYLIW